MRWCVPHSGESHPRPLPHRGTTYDTLMYSDVCPHRAVS